MRRASKQVVILFGVLYEFRFIDKYFPSCMEDYVKERRRRTHIEAEAGFLEILDEWILDCLYEGCPDYVCFPRGTGHTPRFDAFLIDVEQKASFLHCELMSNVLYLPVNDLRKVPLAERYGTVFGTIPLSLIENSNETKEDA